MSATLTLVLVIVLAFVTSRWLAELASRGFIASGAEFVLVGLFVGPYGLGVASADTVRALQPVESLLLGILGFALGLSLRRDLKGVSIPSRLGAALLAGGLVGLAAGFLLWLLEGLPPGLPDAVLWPAIAFACIALVSSEWTMPLALRLLRASGPATRLLEGLPVVFNATAVLLFGITIAAMRAAGVEEPLREPMTVAEWTAISVLGGIASGVLFHLFIGRERDPRRMYLASLGAVFIASGLASGGGLSPIFVNLVAGATCAALSDEATVVRRAIGRMLVPIYAVVLVLAGATWSPVYGASWLMLPLYLLVRFIALRLAVGGLLRVTGEVPVQRRLGDGLTAQGGLAVALALNFALLVPEHGALVLTVSIGALIATDLAAARAIHRTLADAGEVDMEPEVAP